LLKAAIHIQLFSIRNSIEVFTSVNSGIQQSTNGLVTMSGIYNTIYPES